MRDLENTEQEPTSQEIIQENQVYRNNITQRFEDIELRVDGLIADLKSFYAYCDITESEQVDFEAMKKEMGF
jgi:hypothetical protein